MSTLRDRLTDLAEEAPSPAAGEDLWDRGRRYARRRRAGTAVIAAVAVLVLVALAGVAWVRSPQHVAPAGPGQELRLPDRFYVPSPWLPSTDETGPVGPVVALVPGEGGLAAVSTDGAYTYLDLPQQAAGDVTSVGPAVSPDGRWIGYPLTGGTDGEPNTSQGSDPVVGVGVYDTVTGEAERFTVPTEHGLSVQDLAWGGDTLWFGYLQFDAGADEGSASLPLDVASGLAWDLGTGQRQILTGRQMPQTFDGTSVDDTLVTVGHRRLLLSTLGRPEEPGAAFDRGVQSPAFIDQDTRRVAVLQDTDDPDVASDQPEPLLIGDPGPHGLRTVRVPGPRVDRLLGWRDAEHVVIEHYQAGDGVYYRTKDVETGELAPLVATPENAGAIGAIVPQDAWAAPQFHAPAPPDPMGPRSKQVLVGSGIATVVVGVGGLVLWRRRVRA